MGGKKLLLVTMFAAIIISGTLLKTHYYNARGYAATARGCLSCHEGISVINPKMQPYLLTFAIELFGKADGYECAVCHKGNPASKEKEIAHAGLHPNPSSMWVLHKGEGCAQCHQSQDTITSLHGKPLPKPVGGSLFPVTSFSSDLTGRTGKDHVYRMTRGLMSLETGKVIKTLSSNGVIPKGTFPYGDFDMDDPDGPVPRVALGPPV